MKQLTIQGVSPFPPDPIDAPTHVVLGCGSEADAVRRSLEFARDCHRLSLRAIARACGWKSSSNLSEIANPNHERVMPETKARLFVLATGSRLLEQFYEHLDAQKRRLGRYTTNDLVAADVAAMKAVYYAEAA